MTQPGFSSEIKSHYNYLLRYAKVLTGSEFEAKDLVQNASIKAFKNINKLDRRANFKPWIRRILYNVFVTSYKKRRRRQELMALNGRSEAFFYNGSRCINQGYDQLKVKDLMTLVRNTGQKSFEAFDLYLFGYSYQEIAERLGIAIGTVKSRINFVRSKVKCAAKQLQFSDN